MLMTSFIVVFPIETVKASGNTLYVGGSGLGNYSSIQAAINDTNPGDAHDIYVKPNRLEFEWSPKNISGATSSNIIKNNCYTDSKHDYYWQKYLYRKEECFKLYSNCYSTVPLENEDLIHLTPFVSREIIVRFKENINIFYSSEGIVHTGSSSIDTLNEKYKITYVQKVFSEISSNKNPVFSNLYKLKFSEEIDILYVLREYNRDHHVVYAEPNYIYHTYAIPNDPGFGYQWALNQPNDHDIDAPEAWDIETGSSKVTIAIIDTGVDYNHEDLAGNIWNNDGEIPDNDIDDDGNGFVDDVRGWDFCNDDNDPKDDFGHGTHCSGIASAVTNNGVGVAGVCWNCTIMPVKIGDYWIESDDAANGILYAADNGADVISMSWGGSGQSQLIKDALDYAYSKGVVLVAAAGNSDTDMKSYPAGYNNVIAVAAINRYDEKASFSNWGSWVDVAAPGVYIYSTMPTYNVTMTEEWGYKKYYDNMSGTSMACPHVAGLIALIFSKNPDFTPMEILTILRSTPDDIYSSEYIGIGRINAYKAILIDNTTIANLDSSLDDTLVKGNISINGTAAGSTFLGYTVYCGEGIYPSTWTYIENSSSPVIDDVLATLDTTLMPDGVYTIRLVVDDIYGKISEDMLILTFDNIWMSHPLNNDIFRAGDIIEIQGTVNGSTFQNYIIDWGMGENPSEWFTTGITLVNNGQVGIVNDTLAAWNTSFITDGNFFTLRLIVNFSGFQSVEFVRNVYLDPTLKKGWPQRINYEFVENEFWGGLYYWVGYLEPVVSDIDNDGEMEIIVYVGGNPPKIYVFKQDSSMLEGWPVEVDNEDLPGGNLAAPSIADIDNDGYKEIFVNGFEGIYVYNYDGALLRLINLSISSQPTTDTVISDLNNDGNLEIIRKFDPIYEQPYFGEKIAVLDSYGNMLENWPQLYYNITGPDGNYYLIWIIGFGSTPAVGNFDNDPEKEIVVAGPRNVFDDPANPFETWHVEGNVSVYNLDGTVLPGFPVDIDGWIASSPAVGDINNDGYDEIIVATMKSDNPNSGLYVLDRFGNNVSGWPQLVGESIWASPAIADFNNDGFLEIVASTLGSPFSTYVFDYLGNVLPGWPQYTTWNDYRSPVVGDINGDNIPDIVTTAGNGFSGGGVYAWNLDGTTIEGFPKVTEIDAQASATIADIDNDGKVELIASSDHDYDLETGQTKLRGSIYVWELDGDYNPATMHWPTFHHDNQHTGTYTSLPVYVDDNFDENTPGWGVTHFDNIQDGVDAVAENGTVYVFNGIYYENVVIDKTINLIGEDRNNTVIDGGGSGNVVYISADWVSISEFTVQNSGSNYYDAGIHLRAGYNAVIGNKILDNYLGIYTHYSPNNTITENIITNNYYGIFLHNSSCNTIARNNIMKNSFHGLLLWYNCSFNFIFENEVGENIGVGIDLMFDSNHNNISGNTINNNSDGILLYDSCCNNTIYGNYLTEHYFDLSSKAIILESSFNNIISKNNISNNIVGIIFYSSNNNNIPGNTINSNSAIGISLINSSNNILTNNKISNNDDGVAVYSSSNNNLLYHNNLINNTQNAYDECSNTWYNTTLQEGNYWSDYTGTDSDGNGIGDTPYPIPGGTNLDNYPLGFFNPIANFTYTPSNPTTADIIYFIDTSIDPDGNITSWYWNFGDGNISYEHNPMHQYYDDGTYMVTLNVTDDDGAADETSQQVVVLNVPPYPPIIPSGPISGRTNTSYTYSTNTIDPEGDPVQYRFDWGDGTISNWTSYTGSGNSGSASHSWTFLGLYSVKAQARDIDNETSPWSDALTVNITIVTYREDVYPGDNYIDLRSEVDTVISVNANASTYILIVNYTENPVGDMPAGITCVGKYIDIEIENLSAVIWPIHIEIYYTQIDLNNWNITENQLVGIYFWNETSGEWKLYNDTGANTTNQNSYEGYCWANAWHLTLLTQGGDTEPPSKVIGLTVTDAKDGKLNLAWNAATDNVAVDHYNIYRDGAFLTTATSGSYQDSGLINGQSYSYEISAVDTSGNEGNKSDPVSGTPTASSPYNPPYVPPQNEPPVADANGPYYEFEDVPLTFDGSGSTDDGTIKSYEWDFGDGNGGTSVTPTYNYTNPGNYTVSLAVTDNGGKTDTDTTYAIITGKPNIPPDKPEVSGTIIGHKGTDYNYSARAIDPDNDTIRYIFDWDDGTNNTMSPFLATGETFNASHNWTSAGIYIINVFAEDDHNATSGNRSLVVLIDAHFVGDIGYFIDDEGDGIYNSFYSNETGNETLFELQENGEYKIDSNGDGEYDCTYTPVTGAITSLKGEEKETTEPPEVLWVMIVGIIVAIAIIAIVILLYKKK